MIYTDLTYKIRGIAYEMFNNIAGDWSEEILELIFYESLLSSGLDADCQKEFEVIYKEHRIGLYRTDIIVENKIVLELKGVPLLLPLHQAQIISYLKVTGFSLGILINFGSPNISIKSFPNNISSRKVLAINYDLCKSNLSQKAKEKIGIFIAISKEILEILGPGFFHQVYRRAFYDELMSNDVEFELIKKIELNFRGKTYDTKDVRFFKISDILISIIAVIEIDNLLINKFAKYIKHYGCKNGLIINFNATKLDFRYL